MISKTSALDPISSAFPTVTQSYAICTMPRSGSNFLCDILSSTGLLGKPEEFFYLKALSRHGLPDAPDNPQQRIDLALRMGTTSNGICAIKIFTHQFDDVGLDWANCFPSLRFVFLTRRDLLGQALSRTRAHQSKQWQSGQVAAINEVKYDAEAIKTSLRTLVAMEARWRLFFGRNGISPLILTYEEVCGDPQGAATTIASYMGAGDVIIDPAQFTVQIQRDQLTDAWRERFLRDESSTRLLDRL